MTVERLDTGVGFEGKDENAEQPGTRLMKSFPDNRYGLVCHATS